MAAQYAITPLALMDRIGTPDAPVLIDVCVDEDFATDPMLIPTARRTDFLDMTKMLARVPQGAQVVVICQKGLKLSQGVAARLRAHGRQAAYLHGGMIGWRAAPGTSAIPAAALPAQHPSLWVCAISPSTNALATLWLVRRFVDPDAEPLFVAPDAVVDVADRFDAEPLPEFEGALRRFELDLPALRQVASSTVGSEGIAQVLDGLALRHLEPLAQLNAALPIFDALCLSARRAQRAAA